MKMPRHIEAPHKILNVGVVRLNRYITLNIKKAREINILKIDFSRF